MLLAVTLLQALFWYYYHQLRVSESHEKADKMMLFLIMPCFFLAAYFWSYLFTHRFLHAGSVCSGDYLESGMKTDGYLIETGLFILFWFRLLEIFLLLILLLFVCYTTMLAGE